jgi:hypothetical protein
VDAREILPDVNTQARESLGNILRSSLMEGFNTLLKSKSKADYREECSYCNGHIDVLEAS